MNIQMNDNVKSRVLDAKLTNKYRRNNDDIAVRSQIETYYFIKRREESKLLAEKLNENQK